MQINVLEYLHTAAARSPEAVCLSDGAISWSYRDVCSAAHRLAARLAARRRPVALFLPRGPAAVVAMMATLQSGNFYAPLDVKAPARRNAAILGDLRPAVVITDRAHAEAAQALAGEAPVVVWDATDEVTAGAPDGPSGSGFTEVIDADPAYVIFTSGSTGDPKGVVISHRSIIDYVEWARGHFDVGPGVVIGGQSPFHFDNSTLDIYLSLSVGGSLTIIPDGLFSFPLRLMEFVADHRINLVFWVPSVMIHVANADVLGSVALPDLRMVLFAGEVMPTRQLNHWRARLPGRRFANLYGPTEITVDCTCFDVERDLADDEPLPIGLPCRNTDVLVLDERDTPVVGAAVGELCVRGSSLALGYWNDLERTRAAFVQNPLNPHYPERLYRTGDLVSRNDRGELLFVGRRDTQVKHMGYRIELGEIEAAAQRLDGVERACVLYDPERREIVLVYAAREPLDAAALRRALSLSLPRYMLPAVSRRVDALPLNANGKIDRISLSREHLGATERTFP